MESYASLFLLAVILGGVLWLVRWTCQTPKRLFVYVRVEIPDPSLTDSTPSCVDGPMPDASMRTMLIYAKDEVLAAEQGKRACPPLTDPTRSTVIEKVTPLPDH